MIHEEKLGFKEEVANLLYSIETSDMEGRLHFLFRTISGVNLVRSINAIIFCFD